MNGSTSLDRPPGDSTRDYPIHSVPRHSKPEYRMRFGAKTHPGKIRTRNEDNYLIAQLAKSLLICDSSLPRDDIIHLADEVGYLLIVADGMGGAAAGEKASAMAVETVERFVLNSLKWFLHFRGDERETLDKELRSALERADRAIFERIESDPRLQGMGTTLTMAYWVSDELFIVHAGDSRAYLVRGDKLARITHDHTLVQMMIDGGVLTPEAARNHHRRHVLTNVLGGPDTGVQAEIHKIRTMPGDMLLLCTDGLTEVVEDDALAEILAGRTEPQQAAEALVAAALEGGGPDNVTAVLARFES